MNISISHLCFCSSDSQRTSRHRKFRNRTGAVAVEAAVMVTVMLILIISLLELCNLILLHNSMASAARGGVREAIVHGSKAAPQKSVWGPVRIQQAANGNHEIMGTIRKHLQGISPARVQVVVEWPEGTNTFGDDVSVQLTVNNTHLPRIIRWMSPTTLHARSTMKITN